MQIIQQPTQLRDVMSFEIAKDPAGTTTGARLNVTESKKRAGVAPSSAAVLDGRRRLYSPKKRAGVAPSYSTLDRSKN